MGKMADVADYYLDKARAATVGNDALVVTKIYKEPKGASPIFSFRKSKGSRGLETQRIEVLGSEYLRFKIQLIGDVIDQQVRQGEYKSNPNWRVIHVKEGWEGKEQKVLVNVTSLAKRLGISKEQIQATKDSAELVRLIAAQACVL